MGPFAGMFLPHHPMIRQSASVGMMGSSGHRCRAHLRTSRMRCVAAAPSTVDSKPRPGEKKGMFKILNIALDVLMLALQPLLLARGVMQTASESPGILQAL